MAAIADSTSRICKHCQIEKPLAVFGKMTGGSGRTHKCNDCRSAERRVVYAARGGEYSKRDAAEEKSKRQASHKARRGRYVWESSWLNERPAKECSRCRIELPANPAWFVPCTTNTTGLSSWCKSCQARDYDENRAKRNEGQRRYWRKRMETEPERIRSNRLSWQRENRDKKRWHEQEWYRQNIERARELGVSAQNKRRARLANAPGSFTPEDVKAMKAAQKGRCWYCSAKLKKFHVEHRIPLSRGGSNGPENLVLACPPCNQSKGAKMPWELEKPRLL